jgi:hypothetical protein
LVGVLDGTTVDVSLFDSIGVLDGVLVGKLVGEVVGFEEG